MKQIAGRSKRKNSLALYPMWKGYGQSVKGGNDKISCEDGAGETTATAGAETE